MKRRNKRGSLSLSINAIVVLILAITMLGLGLSFMRNIFGSAAEEFEDVGGTIKKQMIDQMKEGKRPVDLSRPKVSLKAGGSTQVYIAFKNDGNDEKEFEIDLASKSSSLGEKVSCCLTDDILPPGQVCPSASRVYLEFKQSKTAVLNGDTVVLPLNIITSSDVDADTCFYELTVNYGTDPLNLDESVTMELTIDVIN
jgi:type II secretory pathway pseudopilin PulG